MRPRFNLTLVLPSLLWPHQASTHLPPLTLPGLDALRCLGKFQPKPCSRNELIHQFLWHGSWLTQTKQQLQLDSDSSYLIAVPLSQTSGMHQVQYEYGCSLGLNFEEAQAFCHLLTEWFAGEEWQFIPFQPDLWLIKVPEAMSFTQDSIFDLHGLINVTNKPVGSDATKLLQKQTEWQMLLYQHPLNIQRLNQGLLSIRDLWLQHDSIGSANPVAALYSNHSWAKQAQPLPASWLEFMEQDKIHSTNEIVIYLDDLCLTEDHSDVFAYTDILQQWEQRWWIPLWHSLQKRQLTQLTLVCDGDQGGILTVRPSRFSFLRPSKVPFNGHSL